MTNNATFMVKLRVGKRTKPEVAVYCYGKDDHLSIGRKTFSKSQIAEWIQEMVLEGIKKTTESGRTDENHLRS